MLRRVNNLQTRLKIARKKAGLTQAEVAARVGITQPTYSELERGESLGSKHLPSIAKVLNVSVYWLELGKETDFNHPSGWDSVLQAISQASPETRDQALRILEALLNK